VNWARVGELRDEIAAGRYRVEVERLASCLIAEARMMS
jgi:anti-sigma28 factor (negative regulator of flagellin synthesis)